MTLVSRKAVRGGSAAEKEEEEQGSPRRMVPLARRRAIRGRKRLYGRGTGLLQLRSLVSDPLQQSFSVRPSRLHQAHRSKLYQQRIYRVPWRLPSLPRQPPRVADMVDKAEEGKVETPTDS